MSTGNYWGKQSPTYPAIFGSKDTARVYKRTAINIAATKTLGNLRSAHAITRASIYKIRKSEEVLGFAVIVEGIVYGVYSNARESAYIANLLIASGLICEIYRYE